MYDDPSAPEPDKYRLQADRVALPISDTQQCLHEEIEVNRFQERNM